MTRSDQARRKLPSRCWDLNPEVLRSLGAVNDADIETHAMAELVRDRELAEEFAVNHRLDAPQKMR
jgi:hypothetical protein